MEEINEAFEKWIEESEGTKSLLLFISGTEIEELARTALSVAFHTGYGFAQKQTIKILEDLRK